VSLSADAARSADVDVLVVGLVTSQDGPRPAPGSDDVDDALGGRLAAAAKALGARGKAGEITRMPTLGAVKAPLIITAGLGAAPEGDRFDAETLRRAAGAALRAAAGHDRVAVALPARDTGEASAVALGALLGNYAFLKYRTSDTTGSAPAESVTIITPAAGASSAAVERAETLAESVALVRDLVNTPPGDLPPSELAKIASEVAGAAGLGVEVLDEEALVAGGYGAIIGVGQGSVNPPRLVRVAYDHPGATKTLALIGKGITFDTGGLSLKPASSMDWMKSDMGGAAAVLGALRAIAALRPAVNVVGYLAIAENMPGGAAQRPSDVVTSYGGTTIEVMNTDAEGRLVMADAIGRAAEDSPDLIIDVATLTGGQLVALGTRTSGVMGNDDTVRDSVTDAATRAGESMWSMPLPRELRRYFDSSVADLTNHASERWGSMLSAGVFLSEFIPDGVPWVHLDIAGPAFNQGEAHDYTPKGGTGVAVRTLVQVAEDLAAGVNPATRSA
jgi:leucyl aminopeptidase